MARRPCRLPRRGGGGCGCRGGSPGSPAAAAMAGMSIAGAPAMALQATAGDRADHRRARHPHRSGDSRRDGPRRARAAPPAIRRSPASASCAAPSPSASRRAPAWRPGPRTCMVTPGGQAGLFAAHHAVCDEGDRALICDPYYATYPGTVRAVGAVPVAVPCRRRERLSPRGRERILARAAGARSLLINSPNNPTGAVYPTAPRSKASPAPAARPGCWLISDEVYDTQVWEGDALSPAGAARDGRADAGRRLAVEEPCDDRQPHRLDRRARAGGGGARYAFDPYHLWRRRLRAGRRRCSRWRWAPASRRRSPSRSAAAAIWRWR